MVRLGEQSIVGDTTHCLLYGSVQVLLDTLTIEDMPALCLDGILDDIVAQAADGRFTRLVSQESTRVGLAA
jgi:hypothetical protein